MVSSLPFEELRDGFRGSSTPQSEGKGPKIFTGDGMQGSEEDVMAYPLFWGSMRDTDTPGLCIASPFTPL